MRAHRDRAWERALYVAAHPACYPFLRLLDRCGSAVRVPGVGVVVNDAVLAREVLIDTERFRKDGPGSAGALWTPVLGPSVLLNMEGEEHRALRGKLAGLFSPDYAEQLCDRVLAGPLSRLQAQLRGGRTVDLVDTMRLIAGSVVCELVGIDAEDQACREMFARGEEIAAMVRLTTRRLSYRQVLRARVVLGSVTEAAEKAYLAGAQTTVMGRLRGLGLSEPEALGAAAAFFLTGTATLSTFVPRLIAILHDSGALGRVAAEPQLLDAAINEAMRVVTPSPVMLRSVVLPGRVGRLRVEPGDRVVIATHNCARAYGGFDLDRSHPPEVRHLWFGAGPHFCIGYPLALAESRAVARAVLDCAPLRVVRRRVARRVLIPTYRLLEVSRA